MASTTIKTRILLRSDTLANWKNSTLALGKGEVAIATVSDKLAEIRVGNGESTWANALKLNVNADQISGIVDTIRATAKQYQVVKNGTASNSWKLQEAALSGGSWTDVSNSNWTVDFTEINNKITAITADISGLSTTLNTVSSDYLKASAFRTLSNDIGLSAASKTNLVVTQNDIKDLAGAMHFRGAAATYNGISGLSSTDKPFTAGDVVIVTETSKEYVFNNNAWVELGDETLYATKQQVSNDINDAKTAVYISATTYVDNKINGLDYTDSGSGFVTVVTQTDGKIAVTKKTLNLSDITDVDDISASIGLSNYALSADVTSLVNTTKSGILGTSTDISSAETVAGAKAYAKNYADAKMTELSGGFLILDCGSSTLRAGEPTSV